MGWLIFLAGMVTGSIFGVFVMALMVMAGREDEHAGRK